MDKMQICDLSFFKLIKKKREICRFSLDTLQASGAIEQLHINRITWATKTDKPEGRTCLNSSSGSKHFPSLNNSIDRVKSDRM